MVYLPNPTLKKIYEKEGRLSTVRIMAFYLYIFLCTGILSSSLYANDIKQLSNYRGGSYASSSHYKTALNWYVMAAERGRSSAQYNLGLIYKNGNGVPKNDNTALKWWMLAAQQGHTLAALNIGVMYERGVAVPQDLASAIEWYSLAGAQVHIDRLIAGGASKPSLIGAWFTTDKKNCRIWNPMPQKNETALWSGGCSDGKVHGYGRVTWTWDTPAGETDFRTAEGESRNGNWFGEVKITYQDGEVYLGELNLITGEPDGYGTFTDTDGSTVSGQFKNDMFIGQASITSDLGSASVNVVYENDELSAEGTFVYDDGGLGSASINAVLENDEFSGEGPIFYDDGGQYIGSLKDGIPDGRGTLISADGTKYIGHWNDGKRYGYGRVFFKNGDLYTGGFIDDYFDGHGTYIWPDGAKYVGGWKKSLQHGQGIHTYADGVSRVGSWTDGERDVSAHLTSDDEELKDITAPDVEVQYTQGTLVFHNGDQYTGGIKDEYFHGNGTYIWANGTQYVGEWKSGIADSQGMFTYPDGSTDVGSFTDGVFDGSVQSTFEDEELAEQRKRQVIEPLDNEEREGIIGIWSTKSDTGGVAVFDRGTFGRVVIFVQEDLYKAVVLQYDWKDSWYSGDKTEDGDFNPGWEDWIRFVPTKYIEHKISDHDSVESFAKNIIEEACTYGEFDSCGQWSRKIYPATQQEIIGCLNESKNEVFTEEQKSYGDKNYDDARIPKIWRCLSSNIDHLFFKKRE